MEKSDEREFLHAMATPLGTAILIVDTLKETFASQNVVSAETVAHIENLNNLLETLRITLRERQDMVAAFY